MIASVDGALPASLAKLKEVLAENGTKHAFGVGRATITTTVEQVPISGLR